MTPFSYFSLVTEEINMPRICYTHLKIEKIAPIIAT